MSDSAIGEIRAQIGVLMVGLEESDLWERDDLARFLLELQGRAGTDDSGLIGDLRLLQSFAAAKLAALVDRNGSPEENTVEGVGHLEIHGGGPKSKRYDNDRLVSVFAARCADDAFIDEDTGEILPPGEVAAKVVGITAAFCGATTQSFNSWRVGVAKKHGIALSDYLEASEGTVALSVVIR